MGISTLLIFLNILTFILAVVMMTYAIPFRRLRAIRWLLLLTMSFCIVSFCTLNVYASGDLEKMIFFSRLRFLGLAFMAPAWLLFFSAVYRTWDWIQKPWISTIVLFPALLTSAFILTPGFADLVTTNFSLIKIYGVAVLRFEGGTWFPFYYLWVVALVILAFGLSAYAFLTDKSKMRRRQILALTTGALIATLIDFYCVATSSDLRWLMLSSGTFILSQLGIIYAMLKYHLLNVTSLAKNRIFRDLPDPVLVLDDQKILRSANTAAIRFFGLKNDDFGKHIHQLMTAEDLSAGERLLTDGEGRKRFFQLVIEPAKTDTDEHLGEILLFREVTVQKSIESRLNENLEFKARLLALIAHDLSGYIESQSLLSLALHRETRTASTEVHDRVDLLMNSTLASQGFISNIMSWVKTQGEAFRPVYKPFEWNMLVKECLEDLGPQFKLKDLEVRFESTISPLIAEGDSSMMSSVMRNLLSNSIRATSEGDKVHIDLRAQGSGVEITVSDEGIGMSPAQLEDLRKMSEKLSLRPEGLETRGYGIGLSLVKHFITLHHGNVSIDSTQGAGTRVLCRIPLQKPSDHLR